MAETEQAYHARRAAAQRKMAARCTDIGAARAHLTLAELHEGRLRNTGAARPESRMAIPA